jgi:Spy/CpxP family protein refolding chaperone
MKKILLTAVALLSAACVFASDNQSVDMNAAPGQLEAKYNAAIEGRTADILKVLSLTDTNKAVKVHDIIITQYRALNSWHGTNDVAVKAARSDKEKTAKIHATLKVLHNQFLAALAQYLTPDQIDQVKDKMTYGKVEFTFKGYCAQYPNLTDSNKQQILKLLDDAREEAMDGGSAKEKTAIFQRYKGIINNYLSKQGLHPGKT